EVTEASHDFWVSPPTKEELESAPEEHREESSDWLAETIAEPEVVQVAGDVTEEGETLAAVKREEPVSFIEKYKHLLDDEETSLAPTPTPPHPEPEPVAKSAPKAAHGDDESIED